MKYFKLETAALPKIIDAIIGKRKITCLKQTYNYNRTDIIPYKKKKRKRDIGTKKSQNSDFACQN
jgi:hypothetical protein